MISTIFSLFIDIHPSFFVSVLWYESEMKNGNYQPTTAAAAKKRAHNIAPQCPHSSSQFSKASTLALAKAAVSKQHKRVRKRRSTEKKKCFVLSCACCLLIFHNSPINFSCMLLPNTSTTLWLSPIDNLVRLTLSLARVLLYPAAVLLLFFRKVFML